MAGRTNTIQTHPRVKDISRALLDGVSQRNVANRFKVSIPSLNRYFLSVIKPALAARQAIGAPNTEQCSVTERATEKAMERAVVAQASTAALIEKRFADYERVLGKAEAKDDLGAWASVVRAETASLRLRAELAGELQQQAASQVQIMVLMPPQPKDPTPDDGLVIDAESPSN